MDIITDREEALDILASRDGVNEVLFEVVCIAEELLSDNEILLEAFESLTWDEDAVDNFMQILNNNELKIDGDINFCRKYVERYPRLVFYLSEEAYKTLAKDKEFWLNNIECWLYDHSGCGWGYDYERVLPINLVSDDEFVKEVIEEVEDPSRVLELIYERREKADLPVKELSLFVLNEQSIMDSSSWDHISNLIYRNSRNDEDILALGIKRGNELAERKAFESGIICQDGFMEKMEEMLDEESFQQFKQKADPIIEAAKQGYKYKYQVDRLSKRIRAEKDIRNREDRMNDALGITLYGDFVLSNLPVTEETRYSYTFRRWSKDFPEYNEYDLAYQYSFFSEWKRHFSDLRGISEMMDDGSFLHLFSWNAPKIDAQCKCKKDIFTGNVSFIPHVKMYVPLDLEHLHDGVKKIFEYISNEEIDHNSKMSRKYRGDGVVIRVGNMGDATKIAEFIGQDEFLQEGLVPANPFQIQYNGVGVAVDGSLSFNSTLVDLLAEYNSNGEEGKSIEGFRSFIESKYEQIINDDGPRENKIEFATNLRKDTSPETNFLSYMSILDYLKVSLDPNSKFEDFCDFYSRFESTEYPTMLYKIYNGEPLHETEQETELEHARKVREEINSDIQSCEESIQQAEDLLQQYSALSEEIKGNLDVTPELTNTLAETQHDAENESAEGAKKGEDDSGEER